MTSLRRILALALLVPIFSGAVVQAQTVAGAPTTIDYQGKALDPAGNPLANTTPANYEMQFRIYDAQEAGRLIWSERQIVTVSKGLFSVRLGEGTANGSEVRPSLADAFDGRERFLGVTILIPGQTTTPEITPRLAFLATPFAYVANKSVSAERLILNTGASAPLSSVNLSQVSHSVVTANSSTTLTDQGHTWPVSASATAQTTITLPAVSTRREYYIFKSDSSTYPVVVVPPTGGGINGQTSIKLKVQGEGIVIQNTENNAWWIVSDTRDKTPVGTVIASGQSTNTPPPGYLLCDGTSYNRTDVRYADLHAKILTAWGYPDATTFRVPDMRGLFLRGVDGGAARDPDKSLRTALNPNGNTADAVGSYQGEETKSHNHTFTGTAGNTGEGGDHNHGVSNEWSSTNSTGGRGARGLARQSNTGEGRTANGVDSPGSGSELDILSGVFAIPASGTHTHSFTPSGSIGSTGGSETRPKNVGVYYFIKY